MENYLIVTRHKATEEYIRLHIPFFHKAPKMESVTSKDVFGKHVAGNLPLDLASETLSITSVLFKEFPPRGREYSLEDMYEAGVHYATFEVNQLPFVILDGVNPECFYIKGVKGTVLEIRDGGVTYAYDSVAEKQAEKKIDQFFLNYGHDIVWSAIPIGTNLSIETYREYVQTGNWK